MTQYSSLFDGATYQSADFRWLFQGLMESEGGTYAGTGLVYDQDYAAFEPIADGASGLTVKVRTSGVVFAWLMGAHYRNDTNPDQSLAIQSNVSGSTRLDAIVLCLNLSGGAYTGGGVNPYTAGQSIADKAIGLAVRVGTPSGSPVAPTAVRTITSPGTAGIFELVIGWVTVPNAVVNVATVADKRGDVALCPWATSGGSSVTSLNAGSGALRGPLTIAGGGATTVSSSGQTITVTTPAAITSVNAATGPALTVVGAGIAVVSTLANAITITVPADAVTSVAGQTGAVTVVGAGGIAASASGGAITIDAKPPTTEVYWSGTQVTVVTNVSAAYTTLWTLTTAYQPTVASDKAVVQLNLAIGANNYVAGDTLNIALFIDGAQVGQAYTIPCVLLSVTTYIGFAWKTGTLTAAVHTIDIRVAGSVANINVLAPPTGRHMSASVTGTRP